MSSLIRNAALAALATAAFSIPAFAQSSGNALRAPQGYVGFSVGTPDWRTNTVGGVTAGEGKGAGYKLYGGYQFQPNLAVEAGGVWLGKLQGAGGAAKGDGLYADVVGLWPVNPQWTLLGRAGLVSAKIDSPLLGSERKTGSKYGIGVQYNLSPNVSIRGEAEHYMLKAFDEKPHVNLYTVGVNYAF